MGKVLNPLKISTNFARNSVRYYGLSATLLRFASPFIPGKLFPQLKQQLATKIGRVFDTKWNVDTDGIVYVEDLGIESSLHDSAHRYSATSAPLIATLLQTFPDSYEDYTFIDMGSGKGRVLLVASDFNFKEVIGVELSHDLHNVAQQNIEQYTLQRKIKKPITSILANALDFEFPHANLVVFLFNPFPVSVLTKTLENLISRANKAQSKVIIYYRNPQAKELFDSSPNFQELELPQYFQSDFKAYTSSPETRDLATG